MHQELATGHPGVPEANPLGEACEISHHAAVGQHPRQADRSGAWGGHLQPPRPLPKDYTSPHDHVCTFIMM